MPTPNPDAINFLQTRRSRPAKTLSMPVPKRLELEQLLTAAARTPDHGKLEPWRFIVIEKAAMPRMADIAEARGKVLGMDPEQVKKGRDQFDLGHLAVAVVEVHKPSAKVPELEQTYSAGAVCLALLNTALAAGWGPIGLAAGSAMIAYLCSMHWAWSLMSASLASFTLQLKPQHHQNAHDLTLAQ